MITYLRTLSEALFAVDRQDVYKVAGLFKEVKNNDGRIFVFGNGGSATTASHFAQDMSKMYGFRTVCLSDNIASVLAYGNDVDFQSIFKLQLSNLIRPGDAVMGISCSGKSENVISAIAFAKHHNFPTVGLTGFDGGTLIDLVDYSIHVPCNDMQICEDAHLALTHILGRLSNDK